MATAQEILDTMEEVEEQSVLEIDSDLRTIKIPGDVKILGVESDEDVFRLHFRMPKMYGEVDLSEFKLRINYTNAKQEGDVYEVKDAQVNGENITFSWLVGSHATKYKGNVDFIVCAKLLDSNGVKIKEFNTTPSTLPVLRGLETGEEIAQKNPDILEDILLRLGDLEEGGGAGGASIDDTKPSAKTTYSSSKIDKLLNAQKEAIVDEVHVGKTEPTDPSVKIWINPEGEATIPGGGESECVYELIETIVCDGSFGAIKRTGMNLRKAEIYMHATQADAVLSVGLEIRNTDNVLFGHLWLGNSIANNGEMWAFARATCEKNGTAYIEGVYGANTAYASQTVRRTAGRFSGAKPIDNMYMYAGGNGLYPAGTTIEIWGVRENA